MQLFALQNESTEEQVRLREQTELKKTSNGLGFFILIYFLIMQGLTILIARSVNESGIVTVDNQVILTFYLHIICAVASSLSAVLIYRIFSRSKISAAFPKSHVPIKTLAPLVMLGMGVSMIANYFVVIFDSNISVFRLKNSAVMFTSTRSTPEILLYVISVAVVPALAEELAFRGVLMGVLRKYGDAFAIMASSIMFAAMHGNTTQIIFAFTVGLIFAFVDCKANSIVPSIIIHFINNFYSVLTDVMLVNRMVDYNTAALLRLGMMIMFSLLGLLSFIYLSRTDKSFFRVSNADPNRCSDTDVLSFKKKLECFFLSLGVLLSLVLFTTEMIIFLLPDDIRSMIPW